MRLLLDTQTLIRSIVTTNRLSSASRVLIEDPDNEKFFRAASIWEIAIKFALGRSDFDIDPDRLLAAARMDFLELPITSDTVALVAKLPHHHRDPFDRFLTVQADQIGARLLTSDSALIDYGPHVMYVP